ALLLTLDAEGAPRLVLSAEGEAPRPLLDFAVAPARALAYAEERRGPFAIYEFTRAARFEGAPALSGGARAAGGGAEARAEARAVWRAGGAAATLALSAGPTPHSARLRLSVEGAEELLGGAAPRSLSLSFRCLPSTTFHGFGERYEGLDLRGAAFDLIVGEQGIGRDGPPRAVKGDAHTTYFPMPWWMDLSRGVGLLIETPRRVRADLCAGDAGEATLEVTSGAPLEALVFFGPAPLDLIAQLSAVVGRPRRPPAWAFGAPWISAQGGSAAVRDAVARLDAAGVPYGAIWSQDWTGERVNLDGGLGVQYRWAPDLDHYPDLFALGADLRAAGRRLLGYANPFIDPALPNHFEEMEARGLLITRDAPGAAPAPYAFVAPNGTSSLPDLTRPEAREYVEGALRRMADTYGLDGWMADFGEWYPLDALAASGAPAEEEHNLFPVRWHAANRAAMEAARPDGDWVLFARSGWTGAQAHAMLYWVGDQEANWSTHDGLPTAVPALLSLGLAGLPYVTLDIGGFSGGPSTQELYMRWVELGALAPVMRTHEGNRRQENHDWDSTEETTAHFKRLARLHLALAPEWARLADEADATSAPMLRALALRYPHDETARAISDQLLIGDDLLAAPVLREGERARRLYLPEGAWWHVWTGARYEGPAWVEVPAPLGAPPLFSRGAPRDDLRAAVE
ncbi:MAG: hypothetical protein FJ138_10795, partial [Deltaproteobacteria bacterium]|nr:hypothetical protein [Deltaproteobacteria bacterium]